MNRYNNPRLITPPREEEEIYPYRRAWRSIAIENSILFVMTITIFVGAQYLGLRVPSQFTFATNIVLALLPTFLWIIFSRAPENQAVAPRRRLLTTFTMTALIANAIAMPILSNLLNPEAWLPTQVLATRIIGYTITMGILQEFTKYIAVRYLVIPEYCRGRHDIVAYCMASAIAYALVLNLNYVLANPNAGLDSTIARVFFYTATNTICSLIVGYGISETIFANAIAVLLPINVFLSALLYGIATTFRSTFSNTTLGITVSAPREIIGLGFLLGLTIAILFVMYFLFRVIEQREEFKQSGQE